MSIPMIIAITLLIIAGLSFTTFVCCIIAEVVEVGRSKTARVARGALGLYFISCAILIFGTIIGVILWLIL